LQPNYAPLTTLGSNAPANWIDAAAIAASALNGKGDWSTHDAAAVVTALGTGATLTSLAQASIWTATVAGRIDTTISSRAAAATALSTATWTAARAGYLDKLNVTGTLAHSDAAATYKADVSGLATSVEIAALDDLLDKFAPALIGTVTGAGTGTEVFVYGGVTMTVVVDNDGNRSSVVFS